MIVIDTPEGIAFFRLAALRGVLSLHVRGLKMSGRRSAVAIAKASGYRGNARTMLAAVSADVARALGDAPPLRDAAPRSLPIVCPMCQRRAVVPLSAERCALETDGTTAVCHPDAGGCDTGFAVDVREVPDPSGPSASGADAAAAEVR